MVCLGSCMCLHLGRVGPVPVLGKDVLMTIILLSFKEYMHTKALGEPLPYLLIEGLDEPWGTR